MSLEKEDAPTYRLKSTDKAKDSLFEKLSILEAFTKETAVLVEDLEITQEEDIAFDESVLEEEIIVFLEEGMEFCYLAEHYKPTGTHERGIKLFSLPVIIICVVMTVFILAFCIYQLAIWIWY